MKINKIKTRKTIEKINKTEVGSWKDHHIWQRKKEDSNYRSQECKGRHHCQPYRNKKYYKGIFLKKKNNCMLTN